MSGKKYMFSDEFLKSSMPYGENKAPLSHLPPNYDFIKETLLPIGIHCNLRFVLLTVFWSLEMFH